MCSITEPNILMLNGLYYMNIQKTNLARFPVILFEVS